MEAIVTGKILGLSALPIVLFVFLCELLVESIARSRSTICIVSFFAIFDEILQNLKLLSLDASVNNTPLVIKF